MNDLSPRAMAELDQDRAAVRDLVTYHRRLAAQADVDVAMGGVFNHLLHTFPDSDSLLMGYLVIAVEQLATQDGV